MISNEELGRKIKKARIINELTQEQLADKINVTKQAVWNWENGKNRIDEKIKESLEEILGISLTPSFRRKGTINMKVKPLEEIDNIDELLLDAEHIVEITPIDNAFSASVSKLLHLVLNVVLGYEIYALSFKRKVDEEENRKKPDLPFHNITTFDWNDVAEDLFDLLNNNELYPIQRRKSNIPTDGSDLMLAKIEYMLHSVGCELFEDFDDDGYRDGYIHQIGKIAEADAYNLIEFLKCQDNVLLTSFKISLLQMAEIIGSLAQT